MKLFDRGGLPAEAYDSLAAWLGGRGVRNPRVLAWGRTPDGYAAGLPDRLVLERAGEWQEVLWHRVERGGWDDAGRRLRYVTGDTSETIVELDDPGRLPELFRERVEQTILLQRAIDLPGGKRATVSARRSLADGDEEVLWRITPGRGVDLNDPALADAALDGLERLRAEWEF